MIYRTELYGIIGAGGFGREVMPVARQMIADAYGNKGHELVFVVENLEKQTVINGHKVISDVGLKYRSSR